MLVREPRSMGSISTVHEDFRSTTTEATWLRLENHQYPLVLDMPHASPRCRLHLNNEDIETRAREVSTEDRWIRPNSCCRSYKSSMSGLTRDHEKQEATI
jgi:hypothetical protein